MSNLVTGMNAAELYTLRDSLLKTGACALAEEVWLKSWKKSTDSALPQITVNMADDQDLLNIEHATVNKGKKTGQRYMAFLIEINDDEQPKQQETPKLKGGRLSIEAAGMCKNDNFQLYASKQEIGGIRFDANEAGATSYVRLFCGVKSRAEIDHCSWGPEAMELLRGKFHTWLKY